MTAIVVTLIVLGSALMVYPIRYGARLRYESATRKRKAVEGFYKHVNAVYDNAIKDVHPEVGEMFQNIASAMTNKHYVRGVVSALLDARNRSATTAAINAGPLREALLELTDEQAEHLAFAWINSAIVSVESSAFFGRAHKVTLRYALQNPPPANEVRERVERFASEADVSKIAAVAC